MSAGRNDIAGLLPSGYLTSIAGFNIAKQLLTKGVEMCSTPVRPIMRLTCTSQAVKPALCSLVMFVALCQRERLLTTYVYRRGVK